MSVTEEVIAMADAAATLASEMQLNGHEIYPEDILDCLATGGLSLVVSDGLIASLTYQTVMGANIIDRSAQ